MLKRGISAIVAVILILLITVSGVTIIWNVVVPLVREEVSFEENLVDLSIETVAGYTVWDSSTQTMSVQVKRGSDEVGLAGLQFIFSRGSNSVIKEIFGDLPGLNQMKLYNFNLTVLGGEPDSISIAPIFENRNVGSISSKLDNFPKGNVDITNLIDVADGLDEDGDGYNSEEDCDDKNALINPGAAELCDGLNNDCDNFVDEVCSCSDVRANEYCSSFSTTLDQDDGTLCSDAGCGFELISYCGRADINRDGVVNEYDENERFVNDGRNDCVELNNWCNNADIDKDGRVGPADYNQIILNWERTGCDLPEGTDVNCYFDSICSANSKSVCENLGGCSWIPNLIECETPLIHAVWSDTGDILADGVFDKIGPIQGFSWDASDYLDVTNLAGNYVLKAIPGKDSTCTDIQRHCFEKIVSKNLNSLQTWGGTIYVNFKDVIFSDPSVKTCGPEMNKACSDDLPFVGGYNSASTTMRDFAIAAYRWKRFGKGKSYIYFKAYEHNVASNLVEFSQAIEVPDASYTVIADPWPDRFMRIDWFLTPQYNLYARVDEGDWTKITVIGKTFTDFKRFDVGWVSSYDGGGVYIKEIKLYDESCVPRWFLEN